MPDTDTDAATGVFYPASYIRSQLAQQAWAGDTRRVFVTLQPTDAAWIPTGTRFVHGPALVTFIQNQDRSIDVITTR